MSDVQPWMNVFQSCLLDVTFVMFVIFHQPLQRVGRQLLYFIPRRSAPVRRQTDVLQERQGTAVTCRLPPTAPPA